jgi:hypothetical protein
MRECAIPYHALMWWAGDVADALHHGLARANAELSREQAVYGLDALDELGLHPVLEQVLRESGYGVHREKRYPADRVKRAESHGERCDFVLTPDGRELHEPDKAGTLFDAPDAASLRECYWMEVKVAHQSTVEGPNPRYSAQVLSVSRGDVAKLNKDPDIVHAGLCFIAFLQDEEVARHDLRVWYDRCIERGLPVSYPSIRIVPITNRLGNAVAAIALAPVTKL